MPAPSGTVSAKEADKQLAELRPAQPEAKEPPKSAAPGTHPLKCVEDDAEALARYRGESAHDAPKAAGLWHRTAYGGAVFIPGDVFPSEGGERASSARGT